jgi:hypothetical protein
MPLPTRHKGEDKDSFVSRCVRFMADKGEGESNEQRVAICLSRAAISFTDVEYEIIRKMVGDEWTK